MLLDDFVVKSIAQEGGEFYWENAAHAQKIFQENLL